MMRFLLPLAIFVILVIFLGIGLTLNPRQVPSPLIDKPAPIFHLQQLYDSSKTLSSEDNLGKVWMLNVWASWCVACRDEHPVLVELSKLGIVPIYGLNYKDQRDTAMQWLRQYGNPYETSIVDADGKVGIDYGVYGVPETYVIDKQGIIRYKHIGPVTVESLKDKILPLIKELKS
ncbi:MULTISPECIES: DsbE family thiol:disulfide interchange protein [Nitrosomonas]|uniref:Cytochrome c biogenesis protein CcmG/thiol:disulfide interchange protein DsbE n=2 Tax=Nitrosomonas eutropha TaxID=916 RepID=A0ABX5M994_9PROT|nr:MULTISPECIES: DsbE family thiol:disulfide interchange protein [Nitrosomonas]ABI59880.1 periplasmic protein thiol--disulfide oxidoreductase DsbE [Nitrosomonas eutropha C91]MXS80380.1 DsbE family thiol:disulfide interchange protein [Nitrosomonas sp. GH22]PXV80118.1 cytochrome c biogenesis protein CcmG/thiol:disulfide interchange protein DsbE [Nitrosomonas eutropha]SCX21175.1 cytochrome c biogenesis protein CcmG, thiol:disulfide interchange protein DsbE [Nitrosomonas eutropha]SDW76766.1 cytoch